MPHPAESAWEARDPAAILALIPQAESAEDHLYLAFANDSLGQEGTALAHYRAARPGPLPPEHLPGFWLGYGSTARLLGQRDEARVALEEGLAAFPEDAALRAFHALTLHNLGEHDAAVTALLHLLVDVGAQTPQLARYARALRFYADRPSEIWPSEIVPEG